VRLADVAMPAGVTATGDPDMTVVSVIMGRGATSPRSGDEAGDGEAAGDTSAE
jgi:hypothetical protein